MDYFDYSLVERAAQNLFAIERLEIGRTAPDIEGRDSEGNVFRLSDFHGKVVVIVFWAHWCGVCMADLPEETKFVAKMLGRPLAWIGVNSDEDVKLLRKAEENGTVNFRSWHDGQEGPIAMKWNVWGWPAMYVLDGDGVIRYKSRITVEFEKAAPIIEALVGSTESKSGFFAQPPKKGIRAN